MFPVDQIAHITVLSTIDFLCIIKIFLSGGSVDAISVLVHLEVEDS